MLNRKTEYTSQDKRILFFNFYTVQDHLPHFRWYWNIKNKWGLRWIYLWTRRSELRPLVSLLTNSLMHRPFLEGGRWESSKDCRVVPIRGDSYSLKPPPFTNTFSSMGFLLRITLWEEMAMYCLIVLYLLMRCHHPCLFLFLRDDCIFLFFPPLLISSGQRRVDNGMLSEKLFTLKRYW